MKKTIYALAGIIAFISVCTMAYAQDGPSTQTPSSNGMPSIDAADDTIETQGDGSTVTGQTFSGPSFVDGIVRNMHNRLGFAIAFSGVYTPEAMVTTTGEKQSAAFGSSAAQVFTNFHG